ncbi:MAG: NUDIX domain-containing protein, partial [Pseudomonadota bacterium]
PLRASDVETHEASRPYTGFLGVEQRVLRHRRYDGDWSAPLDRAVVLWGDAATVLPYDPATDRVLLIEQFRPGPYVRGDRAPWMIEVIAGRIDEAETPEETIRREAEEEAGIRLGAVEAIPQYYPSPGLSAEHIFSFLAQAELPEAGGLHGLPEENEDIRTLILPFDRAMAALAAGEVTSATAMLSLLWLSAHRTRLATAWG